MPLLDRTGRKADLWTRVAAEDIASIDGLGHVIVPFASVNDALARRRRDQSIGVDVPNTVSIAELRLVLRSLSLVSVAFPSFADGRGFSIAKRVRHAGYTGTLRASGPLIADQFAYALACGFDEIELPETVASRQPAEQWLASLRIVSHGYQRGYGDPANILDQRRAARARSAQT